MEYDLIVIGGGLAGAALAKPLAEAGLHVLVLERETVFKDRVRGEAMLGWGVTEAAMLGIETLLRETCGHEVRFLATRIVGLPEAPVRDLVETTPHRVGWLNFYHPKMQTIMLRAAEQAGANVRRGVTVTGLEPGRPVTVMARQDGGDTLYRARLVVAADGRDSGCRKWCGVPVHGDPEHVVMAGVLFEGSQAPEDQVQLRINPPRGSFALLAPVGQGRFRAYAGVYRQQDQPVHLSGRRAVSDFVLVCVGAGMPAQWYDGAEVAGPLACFEAADTWVEHPYGDGVVLIGDAAAASDPSWGCGLSLTLRDVRVLCDLLVADSDWDRAAHAYAAEHDRYFGAIHRLTDWMRMIFYDSGTAGTAYRERAFPYLAEDGRRIPDIVGLGPEAPSDEAARRRLFVEEPLDQPST
jgi:2-polyprenyl-6-methoxyphenol hydroxylase-like FAD-dependent oxidoreductase